MGAKEIEFNGICRLNHKTRYISIPSKQADSINLEPGMPVRITVKLYNE